MRQSFSDDLNKKSRTKVCYVPNNLNQVDGLSFCVTRDEDKKKKKNKSTKVKGWRREVRKRGEQEVKGEMNKYKGDSGK